MTTTTESTFGSASETKGQRLAHLAKVMPGDDPQGKSRWADAESAAGSGGAEFEDLALVQRFAQQVVALGEGSDFAQVIKSCGTVHEIIRDFGGDVNRSVREFAEAAIRVEKDGIALRDQAAQVANLATDLSGE